MKFGEIGGVVSKEKSFKDYTILYMNVALEQGQVTTGHRSLIVTKKVLLLRSYIVSFSCKYLIHFEELKVLHFFPNKCIGTQIRLCRKMIKGQPRIIIWTNLVDQESLMLYTCTGLACPLGSLPPPGGEAASG